MTADMYGSFEKPEESLIDVENPVAAALALHLHYLPEAARSGAHTDLYWLQTIEERMPLLRITKKQLEQIIELVGEQE